MRLDYEQINLDGGTQPRAAIQLDVVLEYADAMREGANFPPVIVFFDGLEYWLADGFHRVAAAMRVRPSHLEKFSRCILTPLRMAKRTAIRPQRISARRTHRPVVLSDLGVVSAS